MRDVNSHVIIADESARAALQKLELIGDNYSKTLFVIDYSERMVGSITDGDIRRGLLSGNEIYQPISIFMNADFKYIENDDNMLDRISELKNLGIFFIPVLDADKKIVKILDLKKITTVIPATAVIMAGGRGERLRPFTDTLPKPMLMVGDKPIIEHNIDRLMKFGITEIYISVGYLADKIIDYFGDGSSKGISIKFIQEDSPLGTIGALAKLKNISNDHILLMNSDVLTNIDYEDFFKHYLSNNSSMCIASIPYQVQVPYAVLNIKDNQILSFTEKPSYTFYSNGGIYLMNKELQNYIPRDEFYNATDLMQNLISNKEKVVHYPMLKYWLDIGKHQDFIKAQEDIKHVSF